MRSSPFHSNVLFLILYYYTSNSLLLYLQLNLAFEGDGGRTGHEDMVVGLVPFDVERAAIHADVALTRGRLAFFFRLKSHEVETDHAACEVDLPDAVCEDFFFFSHCGAFRFCFVLYN